MTAMGRFRPSAARERSVGFHALASRGRSHQHHEFVVPSLGGMECMLFERERALVRMDEFAQAARALLNPLFVPSGGEQGTPGQELLGEAANARVAKCL